MLQEGGPQVARAVQGGIDVHEQVPAQGDDLPDLVLGQVEAGGHLGVPLAVDAEALVLGEVEPQHVHPVPGQVLDPLYDPVLGVVLPARVQVEPPLVGAGPVGETAMGQPVRLENGPQAVHGGPSGLGRQLGGLARLHNEPLVKGGLVRQDLRPAQTDRQIAGLDRAAVDLFRRRQGGVILPQQGRRPVQAPVLRQDHPSGETPHALAGLLHQLGLGKLQYRHTIFPPSSHILFPSSEEDGSSLRACIRRRQSMSARYHAAAKKSSYRNHTSRYPFDGFRKFPLSSSHFHRHMLYLI